MLLFDGFSALCLANAVEPLRAANTLARRTLYDWQFLGLGAETVTSSSGLPVQPTRLGAEHKGRYLFVMPSYGHDAYLRADTYRRLRSAAIRFETLVGLDTGSWLLAAAGLLDGYRATSHWDVLDGFAERFPEVDVVEDRIVFDRDRASCGGATTTLELMLALIERHHGATLALDVAALFMFGERPFEEMRHRLSTPSEQVRAAAALMRRHIEEPVPIAWIAEGVGLSQRGLEHAFQREIGQTPRQLYRSIRMTDARRRLEQSGQSIAEIAGRCGYQDAAAMTRAFKAEFGQTPSAVRKAARR